MNLPLCGLPTGVALLSYVIAGVVLSSRMIKHGREGRRPVGLAVYRKESYTPEGQRLLQIFRTWWVLRFPVILVAVGLAGGLLCRLVSALGQRP